MSGKVDLDEAARLIARALSARDEAALAMEAMTERLLVMDRNYEQAMARCPWSTNSILHDDRSMIDLMRRL